MISLLVLVLACLGSLCVGFAAGVIYVLVGLFRAHQKKIERGNERELLLDVGARLDKIRRGEFTNGK